MRTAVICGVVALVLAVIFVPGLYEHFRQVPKDVGDVIDKNVPQGHLEGVVESNFNRAEQNLRDRYTELYKVRVKAAEFEGILKVQKQQLAKKEQLLQRAQDLLNKSKPDSTIIIAGSNFSFDQVNQDTLNHLATCKVLRKQIESNEQVFAKLQQAVDFGTKAIANKQEELRHAKTDFDVEKAELAALMAQEEVNFLVSNVGKPSVNVDIGTARKAYNDRLNELRARAEYDQKANLGRSTTAIPWEKELGSTTKATDEIKSYFKEGKTTPLK
jgi:DNA repair ATPase RecN